MKIVGVVLVIISMLSFCSCGTDVDLLPNQKNAITNYLTSNKIEHTMQNGVYKHIANSNRVDFDKQTIAVAGDSVSYNFEAYTFTSAPNALFYTNKPWLIDGLIEQGLNPEFWIKKPLNVKVGSTPMIKGVANALPYCRNGDSVVLFITSDLAYEENSVGIIPSNSAIMYILNIENVKK